MEQVFKPNFLNGQVAIITGGATGICYGISEAYLKYGAKVCVTSRKVEVLEKASIELAKSSGNPNVIYFPCDIRDFKQVEKMVDFVLEKWGRVDILVNGAAGNFLVPFEQMSPNAFKTVLEIDTVGTFHCCKAVVAKFFSKNGGLILNISTTLPHSGTALQSHAGPAKSAVDALTRHLSVELGFKNIRVCGLAPGAIIQSEGFKRLMIPDDVSKSINGQKASFGDSFESLIPLQRFGTNADIAPWALFIASPGASWFTGQTIVVDGGQVNTVPNFTIMSKAIRDSLKPKL